MKQLYMKQKVFSITDRFTVTDVEQRVQYTIEGSFFKIPKEFHVRDTNDREVAVIKKEIFHLLPVFSVELDGHEAIEIKKEFTFIRDRYKISSSYLEVSGNWWDMDFEIRDAGKLIGTVHKKWVSWGDTYEIILENDAYEKLIVSLVVAIDCVKEDAKRRSAAAN